MNEDTLLLTKAEWQARAAQAPQSDDEYQINNNGDIWAHTAQAPNKSSFTVSGPAVIRPPSQFEVKLDDNGNYSSKSIDGFKIEYAAPNKVVDDELKDKILELEAVNYELGFQDGARTISNPGKVKLRDKLRGQIISAIQALGSSREKGNKRIDVIVAPQNDYAALEFRITHEGEVVALSNAGFEVENKNGSFYCVAKPQNLAIKTSSQQVEKGDK